MTDSNLLNTPLARRTLLRRSALFSVGMGVSGLMLAGCTTAGAAVSHGMDNKVADDVGLLNVALSLEHQAIAAYQVGAESNLLSKGVLDVAVEFQGHHKQHAALLTKTIVSLGGQPVGEKASLNSGLHQLAEAYAIPAGNLHGQSDVIHYAASLEEGAAKAYLSTVAKFHNRDIAQAAASIEGDETMHWAILRNALGLKPVPVAFI